MTHIDIVLNSSKKNYKGTYKLWVIKHYIYKKKKKKNTNLINNQLEGFFVFHLVLKHNSFLAFSHQTPKAITTFTEPITFDLNIKTIINHHSKKKKKKKPSPLPWYS